MPCSADQALDRFAMRRFYEDKALPVGQPSQKRYVITSLTVLIVDMLRTMLSGNLYFFLNTKKEKSKENTIRNWISYVTRDMATCQLSVIKFNSLKGAFTTFLSNFFLQLSTEGVMNKSI